ncbi:hypothetical protein PO124_04270 [Bacillus licheniformis]|nr:hypothetical protein [Bacillus licheniformis]
MIGITLIPVAMNNMAGGEGSSDFGELSNLALAFPFTSHRPLYRLHQDLSSQFPFNRLDRRNSRRRSNGKVDLQKSQTLAGCR